MAVTVAVTRAVALKVIVMAMSEAMPGAKVVTLVAV